jgi:hypothetical protein
MFRSITVARRSWANRAESQTVLAVLIVIGWLGLGWWKNPPPDYLWTYDEPVYLSIAYDILHFGRFTDGPAWSTPSVDPARPPGMVRTPLYPLFLAATAALDPAFNKTLSCHVEHAASLACPQRAPLPRILQFLMMAAFYLMLWRIATRASGSRRIGWLSLGLALIVAPILIGSVNMLMTEAVTLFFTTAGTLAAVGTVKARRGFGWALVSGAMLGLAGMTRPPFVYLFPAVIAGTMLLIVGRPQWRRGLTLLVAFLFAGAIVISPWIVRNVIVLGQLDLTSGYAWMALTQRVAYDQMNWHQYALFYLCSLPDGNGMGSLLVSPHACGLFQYDSNYETFYKIGSTTLVQSTLIAAGGPKYQVSYLLYHYVLSHPIWHGLVSTPMAMRGLWIDHYWSLVMAVLCIPLTWRSLRILDAAMLAVTLPGWLMLAFYAATSANQWRFNLMIIVPFSLAGGIALDRFLLRNGSYRKMISRSLIPMHSVRDS